MTLRTGISAPFLHQPPYPAPLAPEIVAARPSFLYVPAWGEKDIITQANPTALPSGLNGSSIGFAAKCSGGVYPKWANNAQRYSATRSVLVHFIPDQGFGSESRRIWSDFDGATAYSFVLTFELSGNVAVFCHNGTTGVGAQWSTSITTGQPMTIMGTFDGATLALYVNGLQRATASLSGSLRNVTNGIGIGGNPSGLAQALGLQVAVAWQVGAAMNRAHCERLTAYPWESFRRRIFVPGAAAAPSSFIASWARRPARTIGAGVI